MKKKNKTLKPSSKQKIYPKKKKKNQNFLFLVGLIGRIPFDPTILYDPTYDPSAILNVLVR